MQIIKCTRKLMVQYLRCLYNWEIYKSRHTAKEHCISKLGIYWEESSLANLMAGGFSVLST